jgi:phosphomannomutase
MAKLTTSEIESTTIVRATLENGNWVILVSDGTGYIYRVSFEGSGDDLDATILASTHTALAGVEKYEAPASVSPVTRDCICGQNPAV